MVAELRMDNAILREVLDVLKADPGCAPAAPTTAERCLVASRLAARFPVSRLCARLGLARSTYYYSLSPKGRPDLAAEIGDEVERIFREEGQSARGYRFVHALYAREHGARSEKVVRAAMAARGLRVCYAAPARGWSSYAGEPSAAPPNLLLRAGGAHDFSAAAPNEKWVSDITQFRFPAGRLYLSVVLDCFDGRPAGWAVSGRPDAGLADSSLLAACAGLAPGEAPVVHTDRGIHYFWPGWAGICADAGLTRSMSRKATSPDNARMEGFFGCLKNELFRGRDWEGVPLAEAAAMIDAWMSRYRTDRLKMFRGPDGRMRYDTIDGRRRRLGLAA